MRQGDSCHHQPQVLLDDVIQAVCNSVPVLAEVVRLRGCDLHPLELLLLKAHGVGLQGIQLFGVVFHGLLGGHRQEVHGKNHLCVEIDKLLDRIIVNPTSVFGHCQHTDVA